MMNGFLNRNRKRWTLPKTPVSYQTPVQDRDRDHTLACIRTDVYELITSPDGISKWDLKCNSEPVSICYDSFRFMYRAICLKDTDIIINSCIMPDSKVERTAPLFCTWNDERSKKYFGFGYTQEASIDTFLSAFEEAKKNMGDLLRHIIPVGTRQFQNHQWQQPPILLNYNVAVQPSPHTQQMPILAVPMTLNSRSSPPVVTKKQNVAVPQSRNGGLQVSKVVEFNPEKLTNITSNAYYKFFHSNEIKEVDPEVQKLSRENVELKQFLIANNAKLTELKKEFESLKHRNNILQKSNDVLANNTKSLQVKCDDAEKQEIHWKEHGKNSEEKQKKAREESIEKHKNRLTEIIQSRDRLLERVEPQKIETSKLRAQEDSLLRTLEELRQENKGLMVSQGKIQDDGLLIGRMATEQLDAAKDLEMQMEQTLQFLFEAKVDFKKSVNKTSMGINRHAQ